MLSIRLTRCGRKNRPFYRIGVYNSTTRREGKAIEALGHYDPIGTDDAFAINEERVKYWLGVGARPSVTVGRLLKKINISIAKPAAPKKDKKRRKKKLSPERIERKAKRKARKLAKAK